MLRILLLGITFNVTQLAFSQSNYTLLYKYTFGNDAYFVHKAVKKKNDAEKMQFILFLDSIRNAQYITLIPEYYACFDLNANYPVDTTNRKYSIMTLGVSNSKYQKTRESIMFLIRCVLKDTVINPFYFSLHDTLSNKKYTITRKEQEESNKPRKIMAFRRYNPANDYIQDNAYIFDKAKREFDIYMNTMKSVGIECARISYFFPLEKSRYMWKQVYPYYKSYKLE